MRWWVIFCNPPPPTSGGWKARAIYAGLKLLRSGFRHVMAVQTLAGSTLLYNPASSGHDIMLLPDGALRDWLEDGILQTATVVCVEAKRTGCVLPFGALTCADAVARVLGMGRVLTPWGLYRRLMEDQGMGGVFSTPKADTSAADAEAARLRAEADETEAKNKAKINAFKAGTMGRSLLAFSETGEQGVKTTLGAG